MTEKQCLMAEVSQVQLRKKLQQLWFQQLEQGTKGFSALAFSFKLSVFIKAAFTKYQAELKASRK